MAEKRSTGTKREGVQAFLEKEYSALISLYVHHENGASSIFNFYLTLLTTIAGATIVLLQIGNSSLVTILPAIGILIFLAITLGVVVQEAILTKNVDLANIIQAINLLKYEMLKDDRKIQASVDYLHNPFVTHGNASGNWYARLEHRFWFLGWIGSHQLFISLFNSLELSFLVVVLVLWSGPGQVAVWQVAITCLIVLFLSLFSHAIYANLEFRRRLKSRQLRMISYDHPPTLE